MIRPRLIAFVVMLLAGGFVVCAGCGTTRSTDTMRTATEQLLISDAIDRAVQSMNLQTLAGQSVFLDDTKLTDTVDKNYFISTLRQQLLASGCELRDKREEAEFVVEARAGAIGTDRNDLLFGLPSMNVPQIPLVQPAPAVIPEIPIAKRKDQRGIAKIAVFAYHRATGTPVWQSGIVRQESSANDVWIFGTGPFQRGTIYDGNKFAGSTIGSEASKDEPEPRRLPGVSVSQETTFTPPQQLAAVSEKHAQLALASHQAEAVTPANPAAPSAAATSPSAAPSNATAATPAKAPAASLGATAAVAPVPGPPPAVEPQKPTPTGTAYARTIGGSPLPQPRFNSPK